MKLYAIITLILFLTMLFVPLFSLLGATENQTASINLTTSQALTTNPAETTTQAVTTEKATTEQAETINVMLTASDKVAQIDMISYLIGCVASEMPAEYEIEALKAQAVASYSYARYLKINNESDSADISDNPSVHQAYTSEEDLRKKWKDNYDKYIEKIRKAVEETYGEYLIYNSQPIKPAYHALSSGRTNSAKDVWGSEVPYLVSVNSVSDKLSATYETSFEFNEAELIKLLKNKSIKNISMGDTVTTSNGYVKKINISGVDFTGEELRSLLSLRSGNFTVECDKDTYKFTCNGYGHGVGMSQFGANEMAKQGSTYDEILKHYYHGVKIEKSEKT